VEENDAGEIGGRGDPGKTWWPPVLCGEPPVPWRLEVRASFGNQAVRREPDPWLCVPTSRWVCLCREGASAIGYVVAASGIFATGFAKKIEAPVGFVNHAGEIRIGTRTCYSLRPVYAHSWCLNDQRRPWVQCSRRLRVAWISFPGRAR
jgi:hypothetical protein